MVKWAAAVVAIVAGLLGLTPVPAHAAYDWTAVDQRMERAIILGEATGLSLIITKSDGTTVYEKSFGVWSLSEDADIASSTKWIVGVTMMTLVEDAFFALDDLVTDYIPTYDDSEAAKGATTIRQLLTHTSGLVTQHPCMLDGSSTVEACADAIADTPLVMPPGEGFNYGGASYHVAARVAEVVSGDSWVDLVADRVVTPCAMDFSYNSATNPWVAAGGHSTLQGLDSFLELARTDGSCNGTTVLSASSLDEMYADQTTDEAVIFTPHRTSDGYGVGVFRDQVDASGVATHVSHGGLYGCHPWYEAARGYTAFLFMNSSYVQGRRTYEAIYPLVNAQFDANP